MPNVLATFVTTTTYGTWLPGDLRGYVQDGRILPGEPALLRHARSIMLGDPAILSPHERMLAFDALREACDEFDYTLLDACVESWHVHFNVAHGADDIETTVGRLKNRIRQGIDRGRIWTKGYWATALYDERELHTRRQYIASHFGVRWINGKPFQHPDT